MKNTQHHNRTAAILGLAPKLFEQCSAHLKARGKVTFFAIVFIHALSAGTISLGLSQLYPGPFTLVAFIALFGLLFTADRLLITGARHWTSTAMRLLLLVVLPILNMAFFDLLFFDKDIRSLYAENQAVTVSAINKGASDNIQPIQAEISKLEQRNASLNDSIKAYSMLNVRERNGTGGSRDVGEGKVLKGQQKDIELMQANARQEIQKNEQSIDQLKGRMDAILNKANQQIQSLPTYEDLGLAHRLNLLHLKLTATESFAMTLVSAAYFLFFFFADGLLLLPAVYLPFDEYHEKVKFTSKQQQLVQEFQATQAYQLQTAEIQADIEKKLLQLQHEEALDRAREHLNSIEQQLKEELKTIDALQKEDGQLGERFSHDFKKMASTAVMKAMDQLQEQIDPHRASV